MISAARDKATDLAELSPMDLYPFASEADRGRYEPRFRRHTTLAHARASLALSKPGGKIYEYNFTTDEWVEFTS